MTGNHFFKLPGLAIIVALVAAIASAPVFALGLGEIQLKSALNEPLDAEIRLLNVGDLGEEELLIGLASQSDFAKAQVDRDYFLTSLRFRTVLDGANSFIKVTTQQPVKEPYLDFLVELQWPTGRMLREYTLLLDLPVFASEEPEVQDIQAAQSAPPAPQPEARPAPRPAPATRPAPAAAPDDLEVGDEEYRVQSGDTAWGIASKVRPGGYSIGQTISAIHQLNPQAFINNDVNLLKKGHVLRLPKGSDVAELAEPPEQEISSIAEDTLSEEPGLEALDAVAEVEESEVEEEQAPQGRLELAAVTDEVSDESLGLGVDTDAPPAGAVPGSGDGQLDAVEEELIKTQRENEELKDRLSNLEDQIATMRRMVEINDESMRALQQGLGGEGAVQPAPQQPAQTSIMDYLLYGIIVALGIALVVVLLFRNKQRADESPALVADAPFVEPEPSPIEEVAAEEPLYSDDSEQHVSASDETAEEDLSGLELEEDEAVDPLGEADIHISLGSYGRAEELLKAAIDKDPGNADLRLKLLEVFVATNDLQQFDIQRAELSQLDDPIADAKATEMRAELESEAPESDAAEQPEMAEAKQPAEPETDNADDASDFNLDLDLDEIDLDELSSDIDELAFEEPEQQIEGKTFNIKIPDGETEVDQTAVADVSEAVAEAPASDMPELDAEEECDTKLDLADAYLEMGDPDGAKDILEEVVQEGSDDQKDKARAMLEKIS